jgi:hypothetical protein
MNKSEFLNLLSRFVQRPLPAVDGRHVYLWHGETSRLKSAVGAGPWVEINLHALAASLPRTPRAADEAARLLRQAIEGEMYRHRTSESQQVFVISGCDLLSRYKVPLQPLFQAASESCMVVLALSPAETHYQPTTPLPDYLSLHPTATFTYLKEVVGENAVINTEDES